MIEPPRIQSLSDYQPAQKYTAAKNRDPIAKNCLVTGLADDWGGVMRLAVCGYLSNGYDLSVLQGVKDWLKQNPEAVFLDWKSKQFIPPGALSYLRPEAILRGCLNTAEIPAEFNDLPAVSFYHRPDPAEIPLVENDQYAIGQLAAQALLDAGYTRFYGLEINSAVAELRMRGFKETLGKNGASSQNYPSEVPRPRPGQSYEEAFAEHDRHYRRFVQELPPNSGIFCPLSSQATHFLGLLRQVPAQPVPEALGVIVGDLPAVGTNEEGVAHVKLDGAMIARTACELLYAAWRNGEPIPRQRTQIPPKGIHWGWTLRAREDLCLLEAMTAYCEARLGERLLIQDIARSLGFSQRTLELRLRALGLPSPYEHLLQLRLSRGEQLLRETDLPIERVAEQCGFTEMRSFTRRFREKHGCPPSQFRRNSRVESEQGNGIG